MVAPRRPGGAAAVDQRENTQCWLESEKCGSEVQSVPRLLTTRLKTSQPLTVEKPRRRAEQMFVQPVGKYHPYSVNKSKRLRANKSDLNIPVEARSPKRARGRLPLAIVCIFLAIVTRSFLGLSSLWAECSGKSLVDREKNCLRQRNAGV